MLSRFTSVASVSWSVTKYVAGTTYEITKKFVIPSMTSAIRTVTGSGQVFFSIPKFVKYVTGSDNHFVTFPLSIVAAIPDGVMNVAIRSPLIFKQFNSEPHTVQDGRPDIALGKFSTGIYYGMQGISQAGAVCATYINYLSSMVFLEFMAQHVFGKNEEDYTDEERWVIMVAALSAAVANFIANQSYNQQKIKESARAIAEAIEEGRRPDMKIGIASVLGFASMATLPASAMYSMKDALLEFPFMPIKGVPATAISIFAACTAGFSGFINNTSSFLDLNEKYQQRSQLPNDSSNLSVSNEFFATAGTTAIYVVGAANVGFGCLSSYISIIKALEHLGFFDINLVREQLGEDGDHHVGIVAFAISLTLLNAIPTYQFNVVGQVERTKAYLRSLRRSSSPYHLITEESADDNMGTSTQIELEDDIEEGIGEVGPSPQVKESSLEAEPKGKTFVQDDDDGLPDSLHTTIRTHNARVSVIGLLGSQSRVSMSINDQIQSKSLVMSLN